MPSPVVQSVSGRVNMRAATLYEMIRLGAQFSDMIRGSAQLAPQLLCEMRASYKSMSLDTGYEGPNSEVKCVCEALKIKARFKASYPWSVNTDQV